jgi:hypothetical protein
VHDNSAIAVDNAIRPPLGLAPHPRDHSHGSRLSPPSGGLSYILSLDSSQLFLFSFLYILQYSLLVKRYIRTPIGPYPYTNHTRRTTTTTPQSWVSFHLSQTARMRWQATPDHTLFHPSSPSQEAPFSPSSRTSKSVLSQSTTQTAA